MPYQSASRTSEEIESCPWNMFITQVSHPCISVGTMKIIMAFEESPLLSDSSAMGSRLFSSKAVIIFIRLG
jgi:hypothetical protein